MAGRGDEALLRADVPAIHVLGRGNKARTWMPGTSPGMTISGAWKYESALLPGHDGGGARNTKKRFRPDDGKASSPHERQRHAGRQRSRMSLCSSGLRRGGTDPSASWPGEATSAWPTCADDRERRDCWRPQLMAFRLTSRRAKPAPNRPQPGCSLRDDGDRGRRTERRPWLWRFSQEMACRP